MFYRLCRTVTDFLFHSMPVLIHGTIDLFHHGQQQFVLAGTDSATTSIDDWSSGARDDACAIVFDGIK